MTRSAFLNIKWIVAIACAASPRRRRFLSPDRSTSIFRFHHNLLVIRFHRCNKLVKIILSLRECILKGCRLFLVLQAKGEFLENGFTSFAVVHGHPDKRLLVAWKSFQLHLLRHKVVGAYFVNNVTSHHKTNTSCLVIFQELHFSSTALLPGYTFIRLAPAK